MTIFADASWCPTSQAAGWGAWAIRDGWRAGRIIGGPIRRPVANSTEAEVCGIASAIWRLCKDGVLEDVEAFVVQCDNVAALATFGQQMRTAQWASRRDDRDVAHHTRKTPLTALEREAVKHVRLILNERPLWLRHVKGHTSGTGRNWVNQQCDDEARQHMLSRRQELQKAAACT